MANQFEPFVNIDTVAEFLDVSTKTVRRLVSDRKIPARRVGGARGQLRFRLSEVEASLYPIGKPA